ncbi:MAG: major capsid protein [Pseudomonadota bacterium]
MANLNFLIADNAFTTAELSDAINVDAQPRYGRLRALDLFPTKSITTTFAMIERRNNVLHILPTGERGAPPTVGKDAKRDADIFKIEHVPYSEYVRADDVQNIRAFGSETEMMQVQDKVAEKILAAQRKHDITLEHMRAGALRGQIVDADGSILLDLFQRFGVTQTTIAFDFGGGSPNPQRASQDVIRHMEDNLLGDVMTGVHALCSPSFFDALIASPSVRAAYDNHQALRNQMGALDVLTGDPRAGFRYGGVTFEEYRGFGRSLNADGTQTRLEFIPDGEARFFPLGTQDTFRTYFGPPDYLDEVNTPGLEYYAQTVPDPRNRYVEIDTQSNPLPICMRPQLLVRGTA